MIKSNNNSEIIERFKLRGQALMGAINFLSVQKETFSKEEVYITADEFLKYIEAQ